MTPTGETYVIGAWIRKTVRIASTNASFCHSAPCPEAPGSCELVVRHAICACILASGEIIRDRTTTSRH